MRATQVRVLVVSLAAVLASALASSPASAGLWDKKPKASDAKVDTKPGAPKTGQAGASAEGKVAFSFSDDAKLEQFARLWQQRQRSVLRMTVLQSYWNEEQQALEELNKQFAADYNLDLKKNYRFDPDRKAIIELETPPAPAAGSSPAASPQPGVPSTAKP